MHSSEFYARRGGSLAPGERRGRRAEPMAPAERRAAIVAATLPLLRVFGAQATTKQIAEAAGVAEGTIFRVFKDKDELVHAAIDSAFDPTDLERFVAGLDAAQPLPERVEAIADYLLEQNRSMVELMRGVHVMLKDKAAHGRTHPTGGHGSGHGQRRVEYFRRANAALTAALTLTDEPWQIEPAEAAELLVAMAIAAGVSMPWNAGGGISARTIANVLLHGALARGPAPATSAAATGPATCSHAGSGPPSRRPPGPPSPSGRPAPPQATTPDQSLNPPDQPQPTPSTETATCS